MSQEVAAEKATNFVRNIIDEDLAKGVHKSIQTRFPPEPNGYLHIGHAKSICLNFGLALDYQGKCNLRFDDTNPAKEEQEYIDAIKRDVNWLGFQWDGEVRYTSGYFEQLYNYALELIDKGLAYVCFLDADQQREYRGTLTEVGQNSPYRDTPIAENRQLFEKMRAGGFKEGECVLRAKIDMSSPVMCMRDPILYRIRFLEHHQTGNEWCIYPMYDFAHCISDAIESITHSLCTLEFVDNRRLYDWILDNITLPTATRPYQYEFSRLNLEYTVMSKRRLNQLVNDNLVTGWDDPRMPTVSGLRRRGYTPASIRDFAEIIGISKVDSFTSMSILEEAVRNDLNKNAPRSMAVIDPVKVIIENYPEGEVETISAPVHPQDESKGRREIFFSREIYIDKADFLEEANKHFKRLVLGGEVRLRNAYFIKAERVEYDAKGEPEVIYATYDPETLGKNPADGRKARGIIHWVEASKAVEAEFHIYDRLFNVPNPGKAENFESVINPDSLRVKQGFIEPALANAEVEQAYQFEREGYFCRDSKAEGLVFNKTVGLRDTWESKVK